MNEAKSEVPVYIDPAYEGVDPFSPQIIQDVARDKYYQPNENTHLDVFNRVGYGVFNEADEVDDAKRSVSHMVLGLFMPAGRILAGAGTDKIVTLNN